MDIAHKPGTGPHVTKFKPSKRIKAAHRRSGDKRTLKEFAEHVAFSGMFAKHEVMPPDVKAAGQWMNKKFPGGW